MSIAQVTSAGPQSKPAKAARGRTPNRKWDVLFLGAGASKGAGLPITQELLTLLLTRRARVGSTAASLKQDIRHSFKVLYADAGDYAFVPNAAEYFRTVEIASRYPNPQPGVPMSWGKLQSALAHEIAGLLKPPSNPSTRNLTAFIKSHAPCVVITTNWDSLIEDAVAAAGMGAQAEFAWPVNNKGRRNPVLRRGLVVVLKLHGSIFFSGAVPTGSWAPTSTIPPRPLMATTGSAATVNPILTPTWDDALFALRRAKTLNIVGYSLPHEDEGVRYLLRVGSRGAGGAQCDPNVTIKTTNPDPEAHRRFREVFGWPASLVSEYSGW